MSTLTWIELAAYISAGIGAISVLVFSDADLATLAAFGAFCWLGGVLWQRLLDAAQDDGEDG